MKRAIITLFLVFIFSSAVFAVQYTEDIMKIGAGARPMGMGKAFVAVTDDGNSVFINPAGLAGLHGWQAMSMYTSLFGNELPYVVFTGSTPFKNGNLGFGIVSTSSGQIPSPTAQGLSFFDYYDNLYFITYAIDASKYFDNEKVYIGSNLKIFSKGLTGSSGNTGTGLDMDFGIKYIASDSLSFGLNLQNALPTKITWTSGAQDDIPMLIKAGTAAKLYKGSLLLALDTDFSPGRNLPSPVHFGAEWYLNSNLALRAGLDQMVSAASILSNNPTAGIGLKLGGFKIDYAYHPFTDNSEQPAHFVSISYQSESGILKKVSPESVPVNPAAKLTAPATVLTPETMPETLQYNVRILNLKSKAQALKLKQKLLSNGFDSILRNAEDGKYYLQAGIFENEINAEKLVIELKRKGFHPVIVIEKVKKVSWWYSPLMLLALTGLLAGGGFMKSYLTLKKIKKEKDPASFSV